MSKIPKLRFKEFSGEWDGIKLKTISNKIGSGSTPRGGEKVYKKFGIPFIRSQNVNNNQLIFDNTTYIDEEIHSNMNNSCVIANDILLNITGASIGRSCVVPKDFKEGNVNQHVCIIRLKDDYEPTFLQPFLASHNGKKLVFQGQTGSGREGINFQSIGAFKLNIPSKQEQEKIASFLTSIDTKIEQLTKKDELLQQYKKGVMQKIFNQEIRFQADDGSEFCDWEEKKLGCIFDITSGQSKSKYIDTDGNKIIVDMGGISSEAKLIAKKYTFYNDNYLTTNDLVMPKDDIGGGLIIGKVVAIPENNKFICGDHIYKLTIKIGNIIFLQYVINSYYINKSFRQKANGTAQIGLNKKEVEKQIVPFPCIEEQIKIANFLSSIDTKIEQTQKQLEQTKEFKKALLQQMFV